jgi:hypothetical protein
MRDFKGMKRQRGRGRGGGGGGKPQQNANRAFDSNGPDGVKVRGNAQTVFEKYQQLARDASSSGDRVLAENYLQHAEHYFRLLRAIQPQRPASEILGRDQFASGFDIDFEDEGLQAQAEAADEAAADGGAPEGDGEGRDGRWQNREERQRDDRQRDDRQRDGGQRDGGRDRFEGRDRDRGDGQGRRDRWRDRDDRNRDRDRGERGERGEQRAERNEPRGERGGDERRERFERRDERPSDPLPVVEPQPTPIAAADERPSPVLRDAEGGESHAPAFLQTPAAVAAAPRPEGAEEEAPARRPRRRRAPRTFEGGGDGSPSSSETEGA